MKAPAAAALPGGGVGARLAVGVAEPISESLGVDLGAVRVHSDKHSSDAASLLGARAFAVGTHVFLGAGERPTNVGLMAHEVAHAVQQQGAPRVQLFSPASSDPHEREASRVSAAVVAGERFRVREWTQPRLQRLGVKDALDYFADKANFIPGFRMFTIILGVNPINMSSVDRSAANILRAMVELLPGGALITQALDNYGIFDKVGTWVEQQVSSLGLTGAAFKQALSDFLDSLSWKDIFHLGDVWDRAKRIFTAPIARIIDFGTGLIAGIVNFVKEAILTPLAKLAEGTRAWDLLIAVLGKNPITGDPVPRTADALIGGFMKLIGQEEVYENLKKSRALPRAWAWFQGALSGLLGFVRQVPGLFITTLKSLELMDIVVITRAFAKVATVFGGFVSDFIGWAGGQVLSLLQIIFEVLAPAAMPYLQKAMGAFKQILRNPVAFVGNLVRAGIQGFKQFAGNFLQHLRKSLIGWLTGTLSGAGVYIPQAFELKEIVKFVLSVLGLTWDNVRSKLLKHIPETAVKALETGFDIVVTLVKEGPAAAWDKIKEHLSNLKEMVMEQIMSFVQSRIVQAAITKLLTSLNPAGAFIQAVIAIYNTVMFFVERIKQIAQVAMSFIDSISAIAAGAVGAAAARVEQTMAGLLTLVISFLARLVGLGKVSDAVKGIVDKIRSPIDKALDKVVEWIVSTAKKLGKLVVGAVQGKGKPAAAPPAPAPAPASADAKTVEPDHMPPIAVPFAMASRSHTLTVREIAGGGIEVVMASDELPLTKQYRTFYMELDDWRHFLESIRSKLPADAQLLVDEKLTQLLKLRATSIEDFKTIHERAFGTRRAGGSEGHGRPDAEKEAVRALREKLEKEAMAMQAWAAGSKVDELTKAAADGTFRNLGKQAYDKTVAARRTAVKAILDAHPSPAGAAVQYRGSLEMGVRSRAKAGVRFNPDDFDLDLFVAVDKATHMDITKKVGAPAGQPLPARKAGAAWVVFEKALVKALEAPNAVPGLRAGANYILIREK